MAKPTVSNPSDPVLWCKKAAELMSKNENRDAVYCYEESLKLRPAVPDVWFNLGCLFEKSGDKNAALGAFQTASKMFATDFRFPAERARILAESGKYSDAVESINAALEINPHSELLLSNKAGYLIFTGDISGAEKSADEALSINPSYASAFIHKAHALILKSDTEGAEKVLRDGILANPGDIRLMKMQANLFVRVGKYKEAITVLADILSANENDDEAWSLKGISHAYIGEKEFALEAFDKAIKINPKEKSYKANRNAVRKGV